MTTKKQPKWTPEARAKRMPGIRLRTRIRTLESKVRWFEQRNLTDEADEVREQIAQLKEQL